MLTVMRPGCLPVAHGRRCGLPMNYKIFLNRAIFG
jgi:hypothetical protein